MTDRTETNALATELTAAFGQAFEATRQIDRLTMLAMPARVYRDGGADYILLFPNPDKNFLLAVTSIDREPHSWTVHTAQGDWEFRRPTDTRAADHFIRAMNDDGVFTMETRIYLLHSVGSDPNAPVGIHYDGAEHYDASEPNNWSAIAAHTLPARKDGEDWDTYASRANGLTSPLASYSVLKHRNWPLHYILGNLRAGQPPII